MSRFLVTGGAGFIGSNMTSVLTRSGHSVCVLDNLSTGKRENLAGFQNTDFIEGDIRNAADCRKACAGVDFVLHHAAFISVPGSIKDPLLTAEINVVGTLNLLAAARDANVKRFVYASSCAVYGDARTMPLNESVSAMQLSPYAASKAADEKFAESFSYCYGMNIVGLRYFNVYGPRQDPKSPYAAVIPLFISAVLQGHPPTIFGDGLQTRDFVFVEDVVKMNLLACEKPIEGHQIFNVASGRVTSVNELAHKVIESTNSALTPVHEPPRHGDIRHSAADISKAKNILGFSPSFDLSEGMKRTLDWYQNR